MLRKLGDFLLAKERNAIVVALVLTLLPLLKIPLGSFAAVIVGFVTLARGYKAGFWILIWVALPAVSLLFLKKVGGFDLLLLYAILTWLWAVLLRAYGSWSLVLEVGALIGVLVILMLHFIMPDIQQWWTQILNNTIKELSAANVWQLPDSETKKLIDRAVPMATGVSGFWLFCWSLILTLIARSWSSILYQPGTLRQELLLIRAGYVIAGAAIVIVIGCLFRVAVFLDILPFLVLPFAIAGLSLLHFLANKNKALIVPLVFVYIGFLFLPLFALIILALGLLGFVDSWLNIRTRVLSTP